MGRSIVSNVLFRMKGPAQRRDRIGLGRMPSHDMVGGMRSKPLRIQALVLALVAALVASSLACTVPVFRYALERWAPDAYTATIFHRGPLDAEANKALSLIKSSHANLNLLLVDLDTETDATRLEAWAEQETDELPWLYVTYPPAHPVAVELVSGRLEMALAKDVVANSFRKRITDQLVAGETAVWVLLESGNASRDEAVWALLQRELKRLEAELRLPTIAQEDIDAGLLSVDENELKIAFSAERLSGEDPADEMLVRMLLDTEEDLIDVEAPMVFPIFGRGRVLYGIVGDGITPETLETAASYLVGECSCQVKEDNPGVDLLTAVHWDVLVESSMIEDKPLPELAGILPEPPASGEGLPTASLGLTQSNEGAPSEPPSSSTSAGSNLSEPAARGPLLWTTLGALFIMLLAVAAGSAFFTTKET